MLFSVFLIVVFIAITNKHLFNDVVFESDDYQHHAARISNYYLALKQGQFPVRWAPNLNYSFGYPSFNYTYHLPYMIGSMLHFLNFSIQQSLNLTVLVSMIVGALGVYFLSKSYKISNFFAIILGLIYIFNPYFLLSVYWRGALGELYFISLVPYSLLFIKKILKLENKTREYYFYFFGFSITTLLLIISHLPSLIFLIPIFIALIISEKSGENSLKKIFEIIISGSIGALLSFWYLVPAVFDQWMIKYQLGTSLTQYQTQFSSLLSVFDLTKNFNSSDSFLNVIQLGFPILISLLIGLLSLKRNKKNLAWIIVFFSSLFFITEYSKIFWSNLQIFQYLQYPWRMLWIASICSIMILINYLKEKPKHKFQHFIIFIILFIGVLSTINSYIKIKGFGSRSDYEWYQNVTTASSFNEHEPRWSNSPYDFPEEAIYLVDAEIYPLSNLEVNTIDFNGTRIKQEVSTDKDIVIIYKRLFYPGWEAHINYQKVDFLSDVPKYNGVLALPIAKGKSIIEVEFTGNTKLRDLSEFISLATFIFCSLFFIRLFSKKKNN